ncbi:MAG: hypothetical protein IJX58_03220 [Clostridia bacterium]|nr:hypothetical protein [Clostridia bacterium]
MRLFNFEFFKRTGFYVSLASIVSLVAAALTYTLGFTDALLEYNSSNVMSIALIGIVAFFVLLVLEPTSNYAPLVLWLFSFASLLAYVSNIYMYFTGVFYNGVSLEAFKLIDSTVLISTALFVVSFVAANVAMYLRHSAEEEEE